MTVARNERWQPGTEQAPRTRGVDVVDDEDEGEEEGETPALEFSLETEMDRRLHQVEEWVILVDRRLERMDAKIDRLAEAVDHLSAQINDMPSRANINYYLVGGIVGGLAVGLAIMGVTIGGIVGGLSSLRPDYAAPVAAPAPAQAPAPIIIQMPPGAMLPGMGVPGATPATPAGR